MKTLYNLPKKVIFCKKCVTSNQRPNSYPEFNHTRERKNAKYLNIDKNGIRNNLQFNASITEREAKKK